MSERSYITGILFALTIAWSAPAAQAQLAPDGQMQCVKRAWINAFNPAHPVFPKSTDRCPAILSRPVFTREGALACDTRDGLMAASNAMRHGWTFIPTAGVESIRAQTGEQVSPETFGCRIYHDGTPTAVESTTFADAKTGLGWISQSHLRN